MLSIAPWCCWKTGQAILPIETKGKKVWLWKVSPQIAKDSGFIVVEKVEDADVAIARVATPFTVEHPKYLFGNILHEGPLSFTPENPDRRAVESAVAAHVPVVVVVNLDRAAILTPIREVAAAIVADFGASDAAVLDVLTGREKTAGPFAVRTAFVGCRGRQATA